VFHNRERTVLLRPLEDVLAIHTMRFADEIVDPAGFELGRVRKKPSKREIDMAASLVDGLHTAFDPSEYEDSYRADVLALVERKAAGKNIELPADEEPEAADDLLAALEASLAKA
jgi:DNA end-binding protein Ku